MARIKINERVLEALGFVRRELDESTHDYVKTLHRGWRLEYADCSGLELVYEGNVVPIRCRGEEHLRQIISIL